MEKIERILVTLPLNQKQQRRLSEQVPEAEIAYYPQIDIQASDNPALTEAEVCKADVILGDVPAYMIKNSRRLKLLQLDSAGVKDYIAVNVLPKGAILCNATGAYGLAISETMLGMTLMLEKKLNIYLRQQQMQEWKCAGSVSTLSGSVVLCLGVGNIGGEYLRKCKLLGAYTVGVRRTCKAKPEWLDELHMAEEIDTLLPLADVVAVNLPDTPKTYKMLNRERLSLMKKTAILINTGRGTVVDGDALCDLLNEGMIAGAALDVTDPEPLPSGHPLWNAKNVIITPHVTGGYTLKDTLDNIVQLAFDNLYRFQRGKELINIVDINEGYAVNSTY